MQSVVVHLVIDDLVTLLAYSESVAIFLARLWELLLSLRRKILTSQYNEHEENRAIMKKWHHSQRHLNIKICVKQRSRYCHVREVYLLCTAFLITMASFFAKFWRLRFSIIVGVVSFIVFFFVGGTSYASGVLFNELLKKPCDDEVGYVASTETEWNSTNSFACTLNETVERESCNHTS